MKGLKIAAIAILALTVFGFILMSLWNWLAPAVFGGRTITFWQALGILILSRILFGGFGGRPGRGRHWRARDRWARMTPDERERFRQGLRRRCGRTGAASEDFSDSQPV
jgi:chromate transport protein ChrA